MATVNIDVLGCVLHKRFGGIGSHVCSMDARASRPDGEAKFSKYEKGDD